MKSNMISVLNLKSFFVMAMVVIFLTAAFPVTSMAATATVGDFTVEKSGSSFNLSVEITAYNGTDTEITIPATANFNGRDYAINSIKEGVFDNKGITTVSFAEGTSAVPLGAFKDLDSLVTVNLPNTVTQISANAFQGCDGLKNVNFAEGGESLRLYNAVFANCTSLESVKLPASLSFIANDANVFYGCTSLKNIEVASGNENFFSENGILFEKTSDTEATLAAFPFGKSTASVNLPESAGGLSVTKIGGHFLRGNNTITSVTVPASVNEIKMYAFAECSNLKSVYLLSEAAPEFGSAVFTDMAEGSTVYAANDTVKAAIESDAGLITAGKTVVAVGSPEPAADPDPVNPDPVVPAEASEAKISLEAEKDITADGEAVFNVNIDEGKHINTLLLEVSFNKDAFSKGTIKVNENLFASSQVNWEENSDSVNAVIVLNHPGENTGVQCDEKTTAVQILVPFSAGSATEPAAKIVDASCSGIPEAGANAVEGTVTITNAEAVFAAVSLDVNGDGSVNQVDITESQRYYQSKKGDDNWALAKKGDVNRDGVVDLEDLIAIFHE
ncbi:MAG: leucine-rich repeat protein, partial [Clostridia bacterium]|nr:leucine-rich repeat protein [Clostridia bacterium]